MNPSPLMCFQHCKKANIFCLKIPSSCPICKQELSQDLTVPPFQIPSPFSNQTKHSSLLIKPTHGNFVRDFKKGDLLHIGLSNSVNTIFEFQEDGIVCSKSSNTWNDSLSISLTSLVEVNMEQLDNTLESSLNSPTWTKECYDEVSNNCFDYVITVLNECCHHETHTPKWTKEQFTEEFISPVVNKSIRYLYILRQVLESGVFF